MKEQHSRLIGQLLPDLHTITHDRSTLAQFPIQVLSSLDGIDQSEPHTATVEFFLQNAAYLREVWCDSTQDNRDSAALIGKKCPLPAPVALG